MTTFLRVLAAWGLVAVLADGAGAACLNTSGPLPLKKIRLGDPGNVWVQCVNESFDLVSSSAAINGSTNSVLLNGGIFTPSIGGISSGWNGVRMSSYTWFASSASVAGAGGLGVTYGVSAATGTFSGALSVGGPLTVTGGAGLSNTYGMTSASGTFNKSLSVTGGSGLSVTYGLDAATGTFSSGITAGSGTFNGAGGVRVTYGLVSSTAIISKTLGVGPDTLPSSALLFASDVAKGVLFSPMSQNQRDAIASPAPGLLIFNSDTGRYNVYNGSSWGAVGGGATLSTGTISGSAVTSAVGFTQRSTMTFDAAGFELIDDASSDSTIVKSKGYQYLASTQTYPSGTTTQSTLGACIAGSTATWTQGNNRANISYAGSMKNSAQSTPFACVLLDGAFLPGCSSSKGIVSALTTGTNGQTNFSFSLVTSALSAGTHNVCLTAATNTGTLTIPADNSATTSVLSITELATGGSGYSTPASSSTEIAGGAYSTTQTSFIQAVTGSTITLSVTGNKVACWLQGDAYSNTTAQNFGFTVLVDGGFASGYNSTTAMASSPGGSSPKNSSFIREIDVTPGTHSFALSVINTGSQTTTFPHTNTRAQFGCREVRNAAGTGDVSSNGNNTMSGANTFSGSNSFTGSETHSGLSSFSSTATFSFSPSSNTAPTANALYSKFLPSAAIFFEATSSSITTYGAVNVSSVTRTGVGFYRVNFVSPMSGTKYGCLCTSHASSNQCSVDQSPARTATGVNLVNVSAGSTNIEATYGLMVLCYDYGQTKQ